MTNSTEKKPLKTSPSLTDPPRIISPQLKFDSEYSISFIKEKLHVIKFAPKMDTRVFIPTRTKSHLSKFVLHVCLDINIYIKMFLAHKK